MTFADSATVLICLALLSSVVAIAIIGVVLWAIITNQDASYREKQAEFIQRKRRVDERIQETRKNGN